MHRIRSETSNDRHPMPARVGALVAPLLVIAPLGACSSFGASGNDLERLANPPALHDDESSDPRAVAAAERQIAWYYEAQSRAEAAYANGATPADRAAVDRYLLEGVNLVDSYCKRWFHALEQFERRHEARKKNVDVLSQVTTALLGLAKLHPDVTAVYGAGMTAYAGLTTNVADRIVIAPSSKGVKAKVLGAMHQRAAAIGTNPPTDYFGARSALESYADLCTYTTAKELVDKSIDSATLEVSSTGEVRAIGTGQFGTDQAGRVLRKLWRPNGTDVDAAVDQALRKWISDAGVKTADNGTPGIALFLYDSGFAEARQHALRGLQLD